MIDSQEEQNHKLTKGEPSPAPVPFAPVVPEAPAHAARNIREAIERAIALREVKAEFPVPENEKLKLLESMAWDLIRLKDTLEKDVDPFAAETFIKGFQHSLDSRKYQEAFGPEIMAGIVYLFNNLEKAVTKYSKAYSDEAAKKEYTKTKDEFFNAMSYVTNNEEISSEPVREQILHRVFETMHIPPYPLGDINVLYEAQGTSQAMEDQFNFRMSDEMEDLQRQIDFQRGRVKELKETHKFDNDEVREAIGRESDFWMTMTPRRLFKRRLQMRGMDNLITGKVSQQQMDQLYSRWKEIKG